MLSGCIIIIIIISEDIGEHEIDEKELKQLSGFLAALLRQPVWGEPMIVVEDISDDIHDGTAEDASEPENPLIFKRSRYYRRYPWKRQNGR